MFFDILFSVNNTFNQHHVICLTKNVSIANYWQVGYNHEWNGCVAFKEKQVILATQINTDELKSVFIFLSHPSLSVLLNLTTHNCLKFAREMKSKYWNLARLPQTH